MIGESDWGEVKAIDWVALSVACVIIGVGIVYAVYADPVEIPIDAPVFDDTSIMKCIDGTTHIVGVLSTGNPVWVEVTTTMGESVSCD